ncbi:stalk domain-containing protein [Cohnella boryungensis]|uniref:Stalk domain-containing protein n=1 Tax=Cohnella boryungensis TaxID=768479 RepID=A0ABV8SHB1_9BACL
MKRSLITVLILSIVIAAGWVPAAGVASAQATGQAPRILSVLSNGALLADDGTVWLTDSFGKLTMQTRSLGIQAISGSTYQGIGVLPDGSLTAWTDKADYGKIASASDVKQVSGSHWLKPDGSVWTYSLQTGKPEQVQGLSDVSLMAVGNRYAGLVKSNGDIVYKSDRGTPVVWGKVSNAGDVADVQVSESVIATLLRDGQVVFYNLNYFEMNDGPNYLKPIPVTVATDAKNIALVSDKALLIVRKDGSVALNNPFESRNGKMATSELAGVRGVDRVVSADNEYLFYARLDNGDWIAYDRDGTTDTLSLPYPQELAVSLDRTKVQVGESLKPQLVLKYNTGTKKSLGGKDVQVSIDKPHLLKQQGDGTWKALAVGETTVTITAAGLSKTLTVVASQSKALQGGKTISGVTMLPMKSVFQTLGGTIASDAATKSHTITVGKTQIKLKAGSKAATVNGKNVTLKAAVRSENGQTYFPADLLSAALGAKLTWKPATQTLTIAFGQASMSVSTYQSGQTTKTASGLYAVAGTGKYAGYKLLKGHPYESTTAIYFKQSGTITSSILVDVRKVDLNRKITWVDPYGIKHTNTVGELRKLFADVSNQYTSDWLLATFGSVYTDYFPENVPSDQLIEQYLRETGQIQ